MPDQGLDQTALILGALQNADKLRSEEMRDMKSQINSAMRKIDNLEAMVARLASTVEPLATKTAETLNEYTMIKNKIVGFMLAVAVIAGAVGANFSKLPMIFSGQ